MSHRLINGKWKKPGRKEHLSIIPYLHEIKRKKNIQSLSGFKVRIVVILGYIDWQGARRSYRGAESVPHNDLNGVTLIHVKLMSCTLRFCAITVCKFKEKCGSSKTAVYQFSTSIGFLSFTPQFSQRTMYLQYSFVP